VTTRARADAESIRRVEELARRQLSADEFRAWADGEIPPEEMAEMVALIRWFVRRYPTPADRLRSARRRQVQTARTIAFARGNDDSER
jgi:hypothetical protein